MAHGDVNRRGAVGVQARNEDITRASAIRGRLLIPHCQARGLDQPKNGILDRPVPLDNAIFVAANEVVTMEVQGCLATRAATIGDGQRLPQVKTEEALKIRRRDQGM